MLSANYFDARSTRIRAVSLSLTGAELQIVGDGVDLRLPFADVRVDERLGSAPRRLRFPNGSFCEVADLPGLERLLAAAAHRDGRVDRMQRRLRYALVACVAFVGLVLAAYRWGLPWAAAQVAQRLPSEVGHSISLRALQLLDGKVLLISRIPLAQQRALSDAFYSLRLPEGGRPASKLLFRRAPQIGANAFTLPDGTIVMLDDLITAIGDQRQIVAVFAHELGHAHGRHSLQLLLQNSVAAAFWTFYVGDISLLLAAAPTAIVQSKYSQNLERQADDYGAALLVRNGLSPALLADALLKLQAVHPESAKSGYLSSHPASEERMRHLRALAAQSGIR